MAACFPTVNVAWYSGPVLLSMFLAMLEPYSSWTELFTVFWPYLVHSPFCSGWPLSLEGPLCHISVHFYLLILQPPIGVYFSWLTCQRFFSPFPQVGFSPCSEPSWHFSLDFCSDCCHGRSITYHWWFFFYLSLNDFAPSTTELWASQQWELCPGPPYISPSS